MFSLDGPCKNGQAICISNGARGWREGLPVVWFHLGCNSWTLWTVCASNQTVVPDYRTMMTHTMLMIATIPNRSDFDAARFARVSTSTKNKKQKLKNEMKNQNDAIEIQLLFCNGHFGHFKAMGGTRTWIMCSRILFSLLLSRVDGVQRVESAESDIECKRNCIYFEINTRAATRCRFTLTYSIHITRITITTAVVIGNQWKLNSKKTHEIRQLANDEKTFSLPNLATNRFSIEQKPNEKSFDHPNSKRKYFQPSIIKSHVRSVARGYLLCECDVWGFEFAYFLFLASLTHKKAECAFELFQFIPVFSQQVDFIGRVFGIPLCQWRACIFAILSAAMHLHSLAVAQFYHAPNVNCFRAYCSSRVYCLQYPLWRWEKCAWMRQFTIV